ncbi:MAG: NAD(P)/FAD-dependent oxidoreductase [Clostridia bacterium]|nr:NAD(P)/FAD-dependent oxidoreductase [Clostridia bacterium]
MSGERRPRVAVVGGGAAGMCAAYFAAKNGADVTIFEKNDRLGRKLGITGKGRCNVTNDCPDVNEFLANVVRNPRFLYSCLSGFGTEDTKALFTSLGVPLKTERGRRVFPVSDKASDIVSALKNACADAGVRLEFRRVTCILSESGVLYGVKTADGRARPFDRVIIATGGRSYPATGSTGDGWHFAERTGHRTVPAAPALVGLDSPDTCCPALSGLTLKNVRLELADRKKTLYSEQGELLFTHTGISGPLALSASCFYVPGASVRIDLKPALDAATLEKRIERECAEAGAKTVGGMMPKLVPASMGEYVLERAGVDPKLRAAQLSAKARAALVGALKSFGLEISGPRPFEEAVVTAGGVDVRDVDPKTMESKLVPGLYFCGEVLDVHALTGGYNLQIAFSTARSAGVAASQAKDEG